MVFHHITIKKPLYGGGIYMFHTFLFTSQDDYPEEDKINGKIKEYIDKNYLYEISRSVSISCTSVKTLDGSEVLHCLTLVTCEFKKV